MNKINEEKNYPVITLEGNENEGKAIKYGRGYTDMIYIGGLYDGVIVRKLSALKLRKTKIKIGEIFKEFEGTNHLIDVCGFVEEGSAEEWTHLFEEEYEKLGKNSKTGFIEYRYKNRIRINRCAFENENRRCKYRAINDEKLCKDHKDFSEWNS